jgi:hypothetical protein
MLFLRQRKHCCPIHVSYASNILHNNARAHIHPREFEVKAADSQDEPLCSFVQTCREQSPHSSFCNQQNRAIRSISAVFQDCAIGTIGRCSTLPQSTRWNPVAPSLLSACFKGMACSRCFSTAVQVAEVGPSHGLAIRGSPTRQQPYLQALPASRASSSRISIARARSAEIRPR